MSAITSTLVRTGLHSGIRVTAVASTCQRRSISWMPWEQPDPKLYMDQSDPVFNLQPPQDPANNAESEAKQPVTDTTPSTQDMRKVGEATAAPATAAVGAAGSQEVSTSGKTVPSSIQAGSLRVPSSQTRSMHTASGGGGGGTPSSAPALLHLPTTLLRIPGMPSTWPGENPPYPDQPRIRKRRISVIHEFSSFRQPLSPVSPVSPVSTISTSSLPSPLDVPSHHVFQVLGNMMQTTCTGGGDDDGNEDLDPNPSLNFEKAVSRYMDGVKAREEALAAAEQSADPAASRQVLDEVERMQWRRVVWAALENLPALPPAKGGKERA